MGAIYKNNVLYSGGVATAHASQVLYDNRVSQLEARTIQEAIDKLNDSHNAINSVRYYEPTDMIQYQLSEGTWIDWKPGNERQLVLYSYGDQQHDITNGWSNEGWKIQTSDTASYAVDTTKAVFKSNHINLTTGTSGRYAGVIAPFNMINLQGYNKLKAIVSSNSGPIDTVMLQVTTSKLAYWTYTLANAAIAATYSTVINSDIVMELDISGISTPQYIAIVNAQTSGSLNIMKVWLER